MRAFFVKYVSLAIDVAIIATAVLLLVAAAIGAARLVHFVYSM